MKRRTFLAAVSGSTLAGLTGCLAVGSTSRLNCADGCDIGMAASAFRPAEYTVSVGDTVVWKNTSSKAHTVTAYENAIPEEADFFASGDYDSEQAARDGWFGQRGGAIPSGESFSHTFEVPGTYNYVCIPHERGGMTGQVIVEK
ncbi:plastocyanin/azurin family copper-binding protein [Haloarchaeobius sp. HME9146]|uniref:plastocyanin/azurin family copper-binding protein n=1 Tax=Haloarchaeobius sp. HME9146 TaxID=2978732 RepID=UPI0021BF48CA|nr:plastocyanin/azurin family copper-binding protein [Haloarchaeobius sp. HME9146]MCT9096386.1 plastocyanin/azurin family copper-binding protein [Haloarchaeobius sp. HME9146]